jgi:hypothetical protein|tara:strand:+ start:1380 stop:1529 length:150 start_codon:yes stop_codon:yes gene_type:complete
MKIFVSTLSLLLSIVSFSVLACDLNEQDNLCKPQQVFDAKTGECKDRLV